MIGIWVKTYSGMKEGSPLHRLEAQRNRGNLLVWKISKLKFARSGRTYQGKDNLVFVLLLYSSCACLLVFHNMVPGWVALSVWPWLWFTRQYLFIAFLQVQVMLDITRPIFPIFFYVLLGFQTHRHAHRHPLLECIV